MTITTSTHQPLTVYKASAGSGKTFTLAVEYISLLVSNPENYRHILAVTFTNKATQEMKLRILSQLYGIAHSLSSSEGYMKKVLENTGLSEQAVRANARTALSLLTHHYNFFRVQTIDAFFQSVLRNLAHELDLTANLRVDLNDKEVESKAVDEMIENLGNQPEVLGWVRDYINQNIEEDQSWNVIGAIKKFGLNIFKDFYKEHEQELNDLLASENGRLFPRYTALLREKRNQLRKQMIDPAQELSAMIRQHHVDNTSLFRRGLYTYIIKRSKGGLDNLPTPASVKKALEGEDGWTASKCSQADKNVIKDMAANGGLKLLQQMEKQREENWHEYNSCVQTLSHLSELRLLNAIAKAVEESNRNANRFMLSDTQGLLHGMISGSDTPFIYEKLGVQLRHIMIDEFQDTSQIQWRNFKVLLDNCMAQEGAHNLIVGDVKQSIYRWRQGDWRLLSNLSKSFGQNAVCEKALDTNYRSWERIIQFNNAIFTRLVEGTVEELKADQCPQASQLVQAYDDVRQKSAKGSGKGYVEVSLLPSKDYRANILSQLADTISRLLKNGVQQKDIAILVRSKSPVQLIADYFVERFGQTVRIVSDEAFRLDASLAVNVLVMSLRLLAHPEDNLTRAALVKNYRNDVLGEASPLSSLLIPDEECGAAATDNKGKVHINDENTRKWLDHLLPEQYVKNAMTLRNLPLIDLVNSLYALFQLDLLKDQSAYVCLFYDKLNDYLRDRPADIDDFLEEWDNAIAQQTIQSDEVDGVRIMTIHKSKGLEFDNVIIPFCDWALEKGYTLWCEKGKRQKPFDVLPITPVNFGRSNLLDTVYEEDYREEHFQNIVDNLNLLYVAFTRAGKRLFVTGKRMSDSQKKKFTGLTSNRSQGIEQCLSKVATDLGAGCTILGEDDTKAPLQLIYGKLESEESKQEKKDQHHENPFEAASKTLAVKIDSYKTPVSFRQSNKSEEFVKGEESDSATSYIKMGTILHQLFSTIRTREDIIPHLKQLETDGIITDKKLIAQLQRQVETSLANPTIAEWFRPGWKLYNECSILQYNPINDVTEELRPDRVMSDGKRTIIVDYKFAKPRPEHIIQVRNYMKLLQNLGHQNVMGYLWYVLRNELVKVEWQERGEG